MNARICPACQASGRPAMQVREWRFLRCPACGTLFVEPGSGSPTAHLYADESYFTNPDFGSPETGGYHGYKDYLADRRHIQMKFGELLAHVESFRAPGDLLDVGAGPGFLLAEAAERGWRGAGIDLNPWASTYAREHVGVEVQTGALADAQLPDSSLDLVTMMDLLEHVDDPATLIDTAGRLLRADGMLAVLTPDAGSPVSRALGRRWPEVQRVPEHLVLFSARGLAALLEDHGFEVVGWHSVGKTSDVATLAADVAPLAPGVGLPIAGWIERHRLGTRTVDLDPRTKLCMYARWDGRTRGRRPGPRPRRPARLPRRRGQTASAEQAVFQDLGLLGEAPRYCDWLFDQYASAVRGAVAEVGAGVGTFSERILRAGADELLAIEPDDACAATLEERFDGDPRVTVNREMLPEAPSLKAARFDLIVCQNVLEHIPDQYGAVASMARALRPGGRLMILVPAHPRLYGALDEGYGHFRRYTGADLAAVVQAAGLEVVDLYGFNLLGIPGWWVKNRLGGDGIGAGSLAAYEQLLSAWRPVEERARPRWGLSVLVHATRPEAETSPQAAVGVTR